jgi:hypothetical protein
LALIRFSFPFPLLLRRTALRLILLARPHGDFRHWTLAAYYCSCAPRGLLSQGWVLVTKRNAHCGFLEAPKTRIVGQLCRCYLLGFPLSHLKKGRLGSFS